MGAAIDEVGNRYGRLVVIERVKNSSDRRAMWRCKCDCGNEAIVSGDCLRWGQTKSCGCLRREKFTALAYDGHSRKRLDLVGDRFGRLTVIRYAGSGESGSRWVCRCDCGNITEVASFSLRRGVTRSCGCLRRENFKNRTEERRGANT